MADAGSAQPYARPRAVCIFRRRDEILVIASPDSTKGITGYDTFGGGVELGEYSADAARREMREELGVEVLGLTHLGTVECIFTHEGQLGHDIVFIYEAAFPDPAMYEKDIIEGEESDGSLIQATWKPLKEFGANSPLYPDGLLDILMRHWRI